MYPLVVLIPLLQGCGAQTGAKLPSSPVGSLAKFGAAVDIVGDRLAIGAPQKASGGILGTVYIYDKIGSSWVQQAMLADKTYSSAINGAFGASLSLDDAQVAIGAPGATVGGSHGMVYVFVRQGFTWIEEAILHAPPTSKPNPHPFGGSVALDGNTLFVGASRKNGTAAADWPGAVHVYERGSSGWLLKATLQPPIDEPQDQIGFGWSIVLRGDTAFIGSPGDPATYSKSPPGEVFWFRRIAGEWTAQGRIRPVSGEVEDFFGGAIALDGNTLAVAARSIDMGQTQQNVGGAYAFEFKSGQWLQMAKIVPQGVTLGCMSGGDLALNEGTLLLSAWNSLDGFSGGVFYLFHKRGSAWEEMMKMSPPDGKPGDAFGSALAMDGGTVVVGAYGHDQPSLDSGAAYVFNLDTANLVPMYFCGPIDMAPCESRTVPVGQPSLTAASSGIKYEVWGLGLPPLSTCILNYSTTGSAAMPVSGGLLCLAPPIRRLQAAKANSSTTPCYPYVSYDFHTVIKGGFDPALQPGQQVWFQYSFWDPFLPPPNNWTLTEGATAVICP